MIVAAMLLTQANVKTGGVGGVVAQPGSPTDGGEGGGSRLAWPCRDDLRRGTRRRHGGHKQRSDQYHLVIYDCRDYTWRRQNRVLATPPPLFPFATIPPPVSSCSDMAFVTLLSATALSALLYLLGLTVWRLFLHPLAGVPGPKIAALTAWYEFYWDCPRQGQYVFRVQEMHREFGKLLTLFGREPGRLSNELPF